MSGQLIILFVRHGETQDNLDRILQGHRDTSLTENGHHGARVIAEQLSDQHIDVVYHSPLLRIVQTIDPVLSTRPNVPTHADNDLRGQYLGKFEGRSYDDIDMSDPRSAEAIPDAGVEEFNDFVRRLKRSFGRIVGAEAPKVTDDKDRTVIMATHGVGITSLFKALENSPTCDGFNPQLATRGPDAFEVRCPDSDDIGKIVVARPTELPVRDGELDWDAVEGCPFVIEKWGKEEKKVS